MGWEVSKDLGKGIRIVVILKEKQSDFSEVSILLDPEQSIVLLEHFECTIRQSRILKRRYQFETRLLFLIRRVKTNRFSRVFGYLSAQYSKR